MTSVLKKIQVADRSRVAIENVQPEVDGGRFAVKRTVGDVVRVEADAFADGHDELACRLYYRLEADTKWQETPMRLLGNDRWRGEFTVAEMKRYVYKVEAWVDRFGTWRRDLAKRYDAGQDVSQELLVGAELVDEAARRASGRDATRLKQRAEALAKRWPDDVRADIAFEDTLLQLMDRHAPRQPLAVHDVGQRIVVERERARFSTWYEMFPRSTSPDADKPGTFRTTIDRLPYVAEMGFDVLYLPPIHPIGKTHRKGKNNNPLGQHDDPGSPWAIGSEDGGHDAVNPELGTLADFCALVEAAKGHGIEVALDLALQCSPDHPWVKQHPQWFKHRPDGSIRYAENPPKKYEDIYPIDFDTEDWEGLWLEIARVVRFWIDQGVRSFRVDNPHTKQLAFWEWLIADIKTDFPEVIFLAEAFTRPRTMYRLAKLGFTQSYTYFTWRNAKWELEQYMRELTETEVREYFRPNFWPNTPDILHEYLQTGGRPAFVIRLLLAATLSSNYGMYGPVFELGINTPREHGSEEYLNSEKYEVRHWDIDAPHSLRYLIARVNRARKENAALQRNDGFGLLEVSNDQLLAYAKVSPDGSNRVICVVNLDPFNVQSGWIRVPPPEFGLNAAEAYELVDLMDGARYTWRGEWNYVELNPHVLPGHVMRLEWPQVQPAKSQGE
jgi:starch synthase (maltosyl-transferring)